MTLADNGLASPEGIVAITALIAAVGTAVAAILAALPALRRQKETQASVNSIHSIVNGERTATLAYQGQLTDAVTAAGGTLPAPPVGVVLPAPEPAAVSLPADSALPVGGPVS